jgi:hypothetical protein
MIGNLGRTRLSQTFALWLRGLPLPAERGEGSF